MRDKIINYTLGVSLLLLLVLLPTSCAKEDNVGEKASVTMTFFTRAESNTQVSGGDLLPNERMKTLRVIVARQTGEVLYNVKYDSFEEDENGRLYKTITFSELTVDKEGENFDFYAIANEEGVGYTESWDNVTVNDLKNMNLQSKFLTNANDASTNTLIPQTAYQRITVTPQSGGGMQSEKMNLNFAVAKVRLTIANTSAGDQYVNDIQLSGLNMTSTPLFAGESLSTENRGNLSLGNKLTIHAGKPATVYAYFFENAGGEYKLTATWKNTPQILNIKEVAMINEISRGTELDINITLNATTTPTFNIEVVPWTTIEVDVPPFN